MHSLSSRKEKTLMKIVDDSRTQKVVGVHEVGPNAAEIVQVAAIAVKMGATKADFDATVALHPTAAEELVTISKPSERFRKLDVPSLVGSDP
jgi:glutathione reductase (NADPH)